MRLQQNATLTALLAFGLLGFGQNAQAQDSGFPADPLGAGASSTTMPDKSPAMDDAAKPKATTTPKEAEAKRGQFGIGVESALGFRPAPSDYNSGADQGLQLPSFSFTYAASPLFHMQVLAGTRLALGSGSPATIALSLTLRGLYMGIPLSDSLSLVIPFGLGYALNRAPGINPATGLADSVTSHFLHLEVGLRPEWFITDYFSIHTQAGVVVSLLLGNQGNQGFATYDPGVAIWAFAGSDLMAKAGFTVWFN